jgi:hypothetical protein
MDFKMTISYSEFVASLVSPLWANVSKKVKIAGA